MRAETTAVYTSGAILLDWPEITLSPAFLRRSPHCHGEGRFHSLKFLDRGWNMIIEASLHPLS